MGLLPPVSPPSYLIHNHLVLETSTTEATASVHLHSLQDVAPDEVTDMTMT